MIGRYVDLYNSGEFEKRRDRLVSLLENCSLCPRRCGIDRLRNERGFCKTGRYAQVSSHCVHRGEEPPISGHTGSGMIFFSHCNVACEYCQNYEISQCDDGEECDPERLAHIMLSLQKRGCHNINLVSPTHNVPQIIEAVFIAVSKGLHLPLVYNSNGYDESAVVRILDGIVDIYMPDMKYSDDACAQKYSHAEYYWQKSKDAIGEMYRQVGPLRMNSEGVAEKGLLVRHLVLPNNVAGSEEVLMFLAHEISTDIFLSVMAQYYPCYHAEQYKTLSRKITHDEYASVLALVEQLGFCNAFCQELDSAEIYLPSFKKDNPFG